MKAKILLSLLVGLGLALQVPLVNGQYIPRPTGQVVMGQEMESNPGGLGLAFVTYLSGEALLKSVDAEDDWDALSPNLSLRIGDRVWAQDDGKVEVRFPLGATAWVNYQSELDITRMERGSRADSIQLALVSGEGAFDVKGFGRPGSVVQVDIPNASIRAFRAARFRVNTLPDGTAQLGVIAGSVVLETPDGLTDVVAGHMAEVHPDRRVSLDFLPPYDEWDNWVRSRAEIYDRPAASLRYLPADMSSYAHEFDNSGRWASDPTYGSIWVPAVDQGWSPYSNGRWVWQANDYVWLGFDPWYAPFHYGRWNWAINLGWFWIAPRGRAYWSPGYVGWSVIGDEVSWVPLGRNEVYYGYGNYGPGNVNVFKTTTINITNVYVNSRVRNGVVAVKRDNFLRGRIRQERIADVRNPFEGGAGGAKIIGRPPVQEIKPIRETRQPRPDVVIKPISLPPVRIEKEFKNIKERVVAPTKEKSAFNVGTKPAPLRNIEKEQQLEQWVPAKKVTTQQKSVIAPPPAEPLKKGQSAGKPEMPVVQQVREPQPPPAGKHKFMRMPEPQGGANMAPASIVAPTEEQKGEKGDMEKLPGNERRKKGND